MTAEDLDLPRYVLGSKDAETLLLAIQDINKHIMMMTEILTRMIQLPYDANLMPLEEEEESDETAH